MLRAKLAAYAPEETYGRGDCALNAVALALANPDLLRHHLLFLKHQNINPDIAFKSLIDNIAGIFDLEPNWSAVCAGLLRVRQTDKVRYQQSLAFMLRNLMVREMEKDEQCIEETIEPLKSAFRDEMFTQAGLKFRGLADDVYAQISVVKDYIQQVAPDFSEAISKHHFPIGRYNALRSIPFDARDEDEKIELKRCEDRLDAIFTPFEKALMTWWRVPAKKTIFSNFDDIESSGFKKFLGVLNRKGEWLSYLGLKYIGAYLHMDIIVFNGNGYEEIYLNKLHMPQYRLSQATIQQLLDRQLIENYHQQNESLVFLPCDSLQALKERLQAVPGVDDLFFTQQNLKRKTVSAEFEMQKQQWRLRNVIEGPQGRETFSVDASDVLARSIEAPGSDAVIDWWQSHHYPAPRMVLKNSEGVHWENMVSTEPYEMELTSPVTNNSNALVVCHPERSEGSPWVVHNPRRSLAALRMTSEQLIPSPVLFALFLAAYVAMLSTLSQAHIAAVYDDPDSPRARPPRERSNYTPLDMSEFILGRSKSLLLFKPKQGVSHDGKMQNQAQTPLLPTDLNAESITDVLKRSQCGIL